MIYSFCTIVETCGPIHMFLNLNLRSKCCLNVRLGCFIFVSVVLFLEQSMMFILYLIIGSVKNYEIFMVKTRLAIVLGKYEARFKTTSGSLPSIVKI